MTAATPPTKSQSKLVSSPQPSESEVKLEPDEDFEEGGGDLLEARVPRLAPFFNLASSDPWDQFQFQQLKNK